jgi:hypothetical protein
VNQIELRSLLSMIVWRQHGNIISKVLNFLLFNFRSWFFDLNYKSFTRREFETAVRHFMDFIESYNLHYEFEYFDCDDFALLFKALTSAKLNSNAVGLALGLLYRDDVMLGGHAWNVVLINDELYYFEPQTYELFDVRSATTLDGFRYELQAVIW